MSVLDAASNPGLANSIIDEILADTEQPQEITIKSPIDNLVTLPGGYVSVDGELITTVEVRELTGQDEEAITRASTVGKALNTIISRGAAKIGGHDMNEKVLDRLLAGDRDAIMLGIYKVTFGNPVELFGWCAGCGEQKEVSVDIDKDIEVKTLRDPFADRVFTVRGVSHTYTVTLPTGAVQKDLNNSVDRTVAELQTILLNGTVIEVDGTPVTDKAFAQKLGLRDRRKISEELAERNPGPQFENISLSCTDCESEVVVPISLGGLFQF
jgi:hypothetical protein